MLCFNVLQSIVGKGKLISATDLQLKSENVEETYLREIRINPVA